MQYITWHAQNNCSAEAVPIGPFGSCQDKTGGALYAGFIPMIPKPAPEVIPKYNAEDQHTLSLALTEI